MFVVNKHLLYQIIYKRHYFMKPNINFGPRRLQWYHIYVVVLFDSLATLILVLQVWLHDIKIYANILILIQYCTNFIFDVIGRYKSWLANTQNDLLFTICYYWVYVCKNKALCIINKCYLYILYIIRMLKRKTFVCFCGKQKISLLL